MSNAKAELLIITHDEVDRLDRRIVNEARVFVERGWHVTIALTTSGSEHLEGEIEPGIDFRATSHHHLDPVHDAVWDRLAGLPDTRFVDVDYVPPSWSEVLRHVSGIGEWHPLPFTTSFERMTWDLRPDLVLACDLPALPAAHKIATWLGVPLWYDSHEFYTGQIQLSPRMVGTLMTHEERALKDVRRFFTISQGAADLFAKQYNLLKRPEVLYNAPDFQNTGEIQHDKVFKELRLPHGSRFAIYHGGLVRSYRNLERFIRGFSQANVPGWNLVLLGYGDLAAFQALAREHETTNGRIIVHDAVPQDELPHWVTAAQFCVIPYESIDDNHRICMPNKFSDCIEIGVPVLANHNLENISAIIRQFGIGWTGPMHDDPAMAETLARTMRSCMQSRPPAAAFASARAAYGWKAQEAVLRNWILEFEEAMLATAA